MTKDELKKYPQMTVLVQEARRQLRQVEREISELDERISRGEARHENPKRLERLREVKEERRLIEEEMIAQIEEETLKVERAFARVAPELTPLEHILMTKIYIEGMSRSEVVKQLQKDPEYVQFCYEKSTYSRAQKNALEKFARLEEEEG